MYVSLMVNEKLKVRQIRCASKYITGRYVYMFLLSRNKSSTELMLIVKKESDFK